MRATMINDCQAAGEPIAIVGSSCRFPGGATSPSKLWDLLKDPRDVLTEIPDSRFNANAFYHPDGTHHGTSNVCHSYILSEDHRLFDAQFFGTKPVEANSIDPQQRLLLETVYESLESAGIPMETLQGSDTGVYVGLMTNDYADLLGRDVQNMPTYFASGTARSILSNRVSYFFNWHGPSMTIDTACSSSLVAVHQGVQSLRTGESKLAVVAGTNLLLGPEQYIAESKLKMLSPTGRSRMWDKDADGYARGDGVAVAILKPLSAAMADGDHIECIIRETGINQDGRTKGITMPNPVAQADLIRKTYARAGLDLTKASDRPQYFEAHGTANKIKGTPAGDPVEAEAISTAFFGKQANYHRKSDEEDPLYVGSIKTVIGHTEGTAGLAAVLKASLALQHGVVPPNLLLNKLNPTVRPFYNDLRILNQAREWPNVPSQTTRRASVNSFGFGGANAHAILESYETEMYNALEPESIELPLTPFNFSASSERSLAATLDLYSDYIEQHPELNLRDLSWTLNCRRSTLPIRTSIAASSSTDLVAKLKSASKAPSEFTLASKSPNSNHPKLLGIFTGQGAQWARMGAEMLTGSSLASDCITRLDSALQALPQEHRPQWLLRDEILKDVSSSRIGQALFSQTLCTAIQIMFVDLLYAAGILFAAVVGHSSGEISAAYAAGYLSAEDAIKVAYYRGWSLQYSRDSTGIKGAMMAAGTSFEDAQELCESPTLEGRVCVAASNSSASVTLSGNADAIEEMREIFEDEKKFARLLKVDKAYHSHHMLPCAASYIEALQRCKIKILNRVNACTTWISSVYGKDIDNVNDSLSDTYWSNNMINPVLFSQAVSFAVAALGPFNMALEVGPHPALKGPASQTIQEVSGSEIPYSGTCSRGKDSLQMFSSALGALWTFLGEGVVDFAALDQKVLPKGRPRRLIKGLPVYAWDHDRIYWHESRLSSEYRAGNGKFHHLLGVKCPDGTQKEIRWRNFLHTREIPWLHHHQVQGQIVFPAAGYISAALEIVVERFGLDSIKLVNFQNFIIGQALVLEENTGVEVIYTLTISDISNTRMAASFNCYSDANKGTSGMSLHASTQIQVELGDLDHEDLPLGSGPRDSFLEVETDRFYDFVSQLGFGYTGPFRALFSLERKMDEATGTIAVPVLDDENSYLLAHPGSLDAAIQAIMLAYSFPGDGRLRTLYLPTRIDSIRINPGTCKKLARPGSQLPFYSSVGKTRFSELSGDVDIYSSDGKYTMIQLQGLHTTPLTPLSAATDIPMFTEIQWAPEQPAACDFKPDQSTADDLFLSLDIERVAHFYLKTLSQSIDSSAISEAVSYHGHLLSYASHCASLVKSGNHTYDDSDWSMDTTLQISEIINRYPESIDMKVMRIVGENLTSVIRGEESLLDFLMKDNLLSQFYTQTMGIQSSLKHASEIASQISHRFPHINVLEIGAGAGETTKYILDGMQKAFASYTFTDFRDSQFDQAQEEFQNQSKMLYKLLDIEQDFNKQGFVEESFDLVVASLALYATENLESTLAKVRRLIRPGGYLMLLEVTNPSMMRFGLVLGGLPTWWMGYSEGRTLSPCVSTSEWDRIMAKTGFSGNELPVSRNDSFTNPFSVMLTQAVDKRVSFLRDPLALTHETLGAETLTIVGGNSSFTTSLVLNVKEAVHRHYGKIRLFTSFADIPLGDVPVLGSVLCVSELDESVLVSMTPHKMKAFKELFQQSKNILWVGWGAQGENPFGNMFTGVQRTLHVEMPHLRVQFMNLHSPEEGKPEFIAQKILQLEASGLWEQKGQLQDMLWYTEPEITLQDGRFLIPRIKFHSVRNDRYNSSKRLIIKKADRDSIVTIRKPDSYYHVQEGEFRRRAGVTGEVDVDVRHSLLQPIKAHNEDWLFLVAGKMHNTNCEVITLSRALDSRISVPESWIIRCGESENESSQSMLGLYNILLGHAIFDNVLPGCSVLILEPDFSVAASLTRYASRRGIQIVLVTSKNKLCSLPWIYIHRNSTRRDIVNKIPLNTVRALNIGANDHILSIVRESLPAHCKFQVEIDIMLPGLQNSSNIDVHEDCVAMALKSTWAKFQAETWLVNMNRIQTLSLRDLMETQLQPGQQALIEWEADLPQQVFPATKVVKFSKNKTYWLIGLTGGLGLSLCQWMAEQGACYIALSSRNPKVDEKCILDMASKGCTIRVFANDITDRDSVKNTYNQITSIMPAIAGVAQGAMVLQDTMFQDLDIPRLEKVLKPKVQGSILLDELFSENTLDFMIFFSSMAAITGNPGQIAYNAANMFMASLAANRRSRGLAGYAINIGAIIGNGYVTRELNMDQQSYLYRVGHTLISEQDFREVFAEGIFSCRERTGSAQLCSSLRIDDDESKNWVANPMFQHLITKSDSLITSDKKSKAGAMVKVRLLEATSKEETLEILIDVFVPKLRSALQIDADKPILHLSPNELGLDSLNAVDIRSWFLKEIGVDMPVLKIFNAASIQDLLESSITLIPEALVPNLSGDNADTTPTDLPSTAYSPPQTSPQEPDTPRFSSRSDSSQESKTFNLEYLASHGSASGSSAALLNTGDSSSEQNDDTSSASSLDDVMEMKSEGYRDIQRTVPMSYGQSRFYFLKSFIEEKTAFNVTPVFELTGKLRVEDFARAVETVAHRHEALRTFYFTGEDKQPMQSVLSESLVRLERILITDIADVDAAKERMKSHVFDVAEGDVLRIQLLSLRPDKHWLIVGFDHINMDGISFEVFWSDLEQAYNGATLSQHVLQYPDYALRQQREYEDGAWEGSLKYWRQEFKEIPPVAPLLSFSRQPIRPSNSAFGSHEAHMRLDKEISDDIKKCASMFKVTPYHFHLALWQIFILRLYNVDDMCIGLGDGNRTDPDVQQSIGLFLNLVPIRFRRKDSASFGETLKETRLNSQNAFSNAHVPLSVILSELNVPRSTSHSPLFQVSFNYRPGISDSRRFCGCTAKGALLTAGGISYDLHLDVVDVGGGETSVYMLVQEYLYEKEHADLLLRGFHSLLKAFIQNPATKISWPPLFSYVDIENALFAGRGLEAKNPWPSTIVQRIDEISSSYSDCVALRDPGVVELTYSQLSRRINQIANQLLHSGITSGDIVGVFQSPSIDWVCSMMAVWRVGAAYLPLDKKVGIDRLGTIASTTSLSAILADVSTITDAHLLNVSAKILEISGSLGENDQFVNNFAMPTDTAVIMFTSGSTGVPKGMMISHAEYSNQVSTISTEWGIREGVETILHQSSYAWDMSICQILVALSNGSTLVIANAEQRLHPGSLTSIIQSENVTTTLATPTEYLSWFAHGRSQLKGSSWAKAISGGEMVSKGLIQEFQSVDRPSLKLINAYGPAEATFACSSAEIPYGDIDPFYADTIIGLRTLTNNSVYIVDESLNPLPLGFPGEVVIGGAGVVRGYLESAKTAERFMSDNHSSPFFREKGWSRIHRTGDRARLTRDGGLILMGRISGDTEIKLNGIRMNVEEIESAIVQASRERVLQAVVSPRSSTEDDSRKFIVAFVVIADSDTIENQGDFVEQLARDLDLPQYMRPAAIIPIDRIPQNSSGKVDRFAVNKLPIPQISSGDAKSQNLAPLEQCLRELWQETFPRDLASRHSIQPNSDYFHTGGGSLSLVNLQALLKERLGVSVSLPQLFESSTLKGMAALISNSSGSDGAVSINWDEEIENILTSSQQASVYIDSIRKPTGPSVVVLTGATGFIGKEIVRHLLDDDTIQVIHCLAVRKPQDLLPSIFSHPKVHVHSGDLGAPLLGLSEADVASIFSQADVVIHNGADVSFMKTYQSLKLINVASTKELLMLSLPRKVPFHFVSSASVTRLASQESFGETSLASHPPPTIPNDGYMAAKWVCEVYLERASQRFGIPVWIHRPSSVQGKDAPELDLISNIMEYSQITKTIPDTKAWPGGFDMVTVESVASQIRDAVRLSGSSEAGQGVHFLFESGDLELNHEEVQTIMESGTGEQFQTVPVAEWVDLAEDAGMSSLLGMFLREAKDGQVLLPKLIKSGS
ncbi:hypothetical protein N7478_009454 [Penicillium angulare]|uniref:uncharacterized protein n=1 Tax=Penicillium angulare TaxID=116970 RepID=UPI0025404456|nr:uncharacterized protein N7478_009454 [Penicillium angulare]KAJ5266646.1 hypothetical protein N7478_009454 [Penicillium angulare]